MIVSDSSERKHGTAFGFPGPGVLVRCSSVEAKRPYARCPRSGMVEVEMYFS